MLKDVKHHERNCEAKSKRGPYEKRKSCELGEKKANLQRRTGLLQEELRSKLAEINVDAVDFLKDFTYSTLRLMGKVDKAKAIVDMFDSLDNMKSSSTVSDIEAIGVVFNGGLSAKKYTNIASILNKRKRKNLLLPPFKKLANIREELLLPKPCFITNMNTLEREKVVFSKPSDVLDDLGDQASNQKKPNVVGYKISLVNAVVKVLQEEINEIKEAVDETGSNNQQLYLSIRWGIDGTNVESTVHTKKAKRHSTTKAVRGIGGVIDISVKNSENIYTPIYRQKNPSSHLASRVLCEVLGDELCPMTLSILVNSFALDAERLANSSIEIGDLTFLTRRVYVMCDAKMTREIAGNASGGSSWVSWKCETQRKDIKEVKECPPTRTNIQNTRLFELLRVR